MFSLFHHPAYVVPLPEAHSFPMSKYGLLPGALRELGAPFRIEAPEPIGDDWIAAVHEPDYARSVIAARVDPATERRIGFAVTPAVSLRSRLAAGGTWAAALRALEDGFAANGAGGSHHAMPAHGAGYCVLNDLAIAAHRLTAERRAQRVLIVDLDVHQGDGTAVMMAGRADVFTFSMHAERNFPARKSRSGLDIALPDGTGDAAYLEALERALPRLLGDFGPDLILYQAGVDVHADDRLGRLALTDAGLEAREALVMQAARRRGIALASTLGGGYAQGDAARMELARRHARSLAALAKAAS